MEVRIITAEAGWVIFSEQTEEKGTEIYKWSDVMEHLDELRNCNLI